MPLADPEIIRRPSRLAALRATGLLDAPPQEALDRLTRLATRLIGVPIALVSLVDENRQRFASEVGLAEPWSSARQTALGHSFCQHVVATRGPLVIEDARVHPLMSDNLAIPELGVVAYAGMPLFSETGEVLGSFCAIDTAPRAWTTEQLETLTDLAHAANAEVQLRAATRLLADRQTFLADLLDHTSELVCAADADGRMAYTNDAMVSLTGYSAEQLATMRPVEIVADDCKEGFALAARRIRDKGEVVALETIIVTASGQRLYCRGRATPVIDDQGTVTGARIIFRDLTKEREAERLKDELIALVSHELRTPVGAIRGALKILGPHVAHLEGMPRKLFDMASRNADRLLGLVNDLLDIERLESGHATLQREHVAAAALLEQARDAVLPLAEGGGIDIALGGDAGLVDVDAGRVQQVLVNLVGNAIKFSPRGSTIALSAHIASGDAPAMARFCVADQGRGIPPDKLERIFERFEQVTATDASEKGGAGLGLAISKAIVEQHGGRIWAESGEGAGSRIYFTVPAA